MIQRTGLYLNLFGVISFGFWPFRRAEGCFIEVAQAA